jgi:hypothetical protein
MMAERSARNEMTKTKMKGDKDDHEVTDECVDHDIGTDVDDGDEADKNDDNNK